MPPRPVPLPSAGWILAAALCVACAGRGGGEPQPASDPVPPIDRVYEPDVDAGSVEPCGCSQVNDDYAYQPLECLCRVDGSECPARLEDALNTYCSRETALSARRVEGCGLVRLDHGTGNGAFLTFDAASGELIGAFQVTDVPFGACGAFGYVGGQALFFAGEDPAIASPCPVANHFRACDPDAGVLGTSP